MSTSTHSTTVAHEFCCPSCAAAVTIELVNDTDLVYQCQNDRCRRAVSVNCPEAMGIREVVAMPVPRRGRLSTAHVTCAIAAYARKHGYSAATVRTTSRLRYEALAAYKAAS